MGRAIDRILRERRIAPPRSRHLDESHALRGAGRSGPHLAGRGDDRLGPLTNEEIRVRSSIGFFLFVPSGVDERLLDNAGFEVKSVEDKTANMAFMARNWLDVRDRYSSDLIKIEGEESFSGQQSFFKVAAKIAEERRLSRFAFHAVKKPG